ANLLYLESLNLSQNHIRFGEGLENLFRLKELRLDANKISYSVNITSLQNLEVLSVSYNYLSVLGTAPDSVYSKLKELDLQGNEFRNTDSIKVQQFPNLKEIRLNKNRIFKADTLGAIVSLERVEMDDNRITDISKLMGLKNLKRFSARSNL